jgi:predicted small lipoprotein YifL
MTNELLQVAVAILVIVLPLLVAWALVTGSCTRRGPRHPPPSDKNADD